MLSAAAAAPLHVAHSTLWIVVALLVGVAILYFIARIVLMALAAAVVVAALYLLFAPGFGLPSAHTLYNDALGRTQAKTQTELKAEQAKLAKAAIKQATKSLTSTITVPTH